MCFLKFSVSNNSQRFHRENTITVDILITLIEWNNFFSFYKRRCHNAQEIKKKKKKKNASFNARRTWCAISERNPNINPDNIRHH